MRKSCIDFNLTPSMMLKEFVDFQLTDGLQADPLCSNVTRVCVLDGFHIHQSLSLDTRLLNAFLDHVNIAELYHLVPIRLCLGLYGVIVFGEAGTKDVLLTFVLGHIGETFCYVTYIRRTKPWGHEADIEHDTTPHAAC